jgi:diketogulonate reductase-like aldo/keto reductase
MSDIINTNRRKFIELLGMVTAGLVIPDNILATPRQKNQIRKAIPKTGELIPIIGMGTSGTFERLDTTKTLEELLKLTQTFFDMGGGMIDSSPMYGSAQEVIGQILPMIKGNKNLFSATKVWVDGKSNGVQQIQKSRQLWGINNFDLMQIHNLRDWEKHFETLKLMKLNGDIRYIGVTTSHGQKHRPLVKLLKKYDFDFVQLSYNIADREVEPQLLSIAQERGIAVILNRPFQRGNLFRMVKGKSLPNWVQEFDCNSWGHYFLKFVASHPAVTCTIPATSKQKHMKDNMTAGLGRLPTNKQRIKMLKYFESL